LYYIYKIIFSKTKQFYFGGRYSKKAKPEELGITYFTTSSLVQNLLFTHGKDNVVFEVIEVFEDKDACLAAECNLINEHRDHHLCLNRQWNEETALKVSLGNKKFLEENPDRVKQMVSQATQAITGSFWITNGAVNKRINGSIPPGYVKGRNWSPPNKKGIN